MHILSSCRAFSLLALLLIGVLRVAGMSRAPLLRSDLVPSLHSSAVKLSEMKDPRPDGISYERKAVILRKYLQQTYPNKSLADFSQSGLQKIYLTYSDHLSAEESETFCGLIISTPKSRDSDWEVEITGAHGRANWTLLTGLIEALPSISTLKWTESAPIPARILTTIEAKHPTCRLYYSLSYRPNFRDPEAFDLEFEDENDEKDVLRSPNDAKENGIESIMHSTALYSFKADIDEYDSDASTINTFHRILSTCPNIRELDIDIARRSFGFYSKTTGPSRDNAFDFSTSNDSLPPLEVLTLRKYDLDSGIKAQELAVYETEPDSLRWPWDQLPTSIVQSIGHRNFRFVGGFVKGAPIRRKVRWENTAEETNLDAWMRLMNWTQINTLNLDQPSSQLQKLEGGFLPNLKHVSFGANWCSWQPVLHFLTNVSALESLAIRDVGYFSPDSVIEIITAQHCPSLTTLRLDRTFLNSTHLSQLLRHCPHIEHLNLNMDRTSQWNYEILDTIAGFPALRSLVLRFDLRRDDMKEVHGDPSLGYSWEDVYYLGDRSDFIDEDDEFVLLGLKEYLIKKKVGQRFETIQTFVGSLEVPEAAVSLKYA